MKKENINNLNIYKLIWIFTFGCVLGWIIELIVFWFKYKYFIYFQGLVYGPFQPIYGLGLVIIFIVFNIYKNKNVFICFLIGFLVFGCFEYFSSWFQEFFLGSYTWNYSSYFKFNLNGRVNLNYCLVFGIAAMIWAKLFQDKITLFLNKFTSKTINKYISSILIILFSINIFLTIAATSRKVERHYNIPPANNFEKLLDKHYDDAFMRKWLSKVRAVKK